MYKLLIVDDETHLVESLAETIEWKQYGIETVYQAYSAFEAIDVLQVESIDILITDIRMPGMSGIELLETVRRRWPHIKCMLLSGHSDFEYARSALQLRSVDYLLKPVSDYEITNSVSKAVALLREEWEQIASMQKATLALREHLPLLRSKLLKQLLLRHRIPRQTLTGKISQYGLPFRLDKVVFVILARLEREFGAYDANSLELFEFAVGNIAEEIFAGDFVLWYGKDEHDHLTMLVQPLKEPGGKETGGLAEAQIVSDRAVQVQEKVRQFLKGGISVTISEPGRFPEAVSELYESCLSVFRKRIGEDSDFFYVVNSEVQESGSSSYMLSALYAPPALPQLLEAGRWTDALRKLEVLFEQMRASPHHAEEYLLEGYSTIVNAYSYVAHKHGKSLSRLLGSDYEHMMRVGWFRTLSAFQEWTLSSLHKIREVIESEPTINRSQVIRDVHQFIESNLHRDVSLQAIADHVHLHPVYLSKLYKTETGEGMSDFMYRLRMEKAAYMLGSTDRKIYEITSELGYQNPQYFSKVFRKYFGMTPQEYRDSM